MCTGLVVLALTGIGAEGLLGIRIWAVIVALAGAALVLGLPWRHGVAR